LICLFSDEEIASKKRKIDESQNNTLRATLKKTEEKLTAQAHKLLSLPTKNESEMKRLSDELIRVWSEMAATVNRRGTKIECVKCGEIARNTGLFRCASCYARTYALRQKLKVENYENTELIDECCT
jgi:ribosomal protein L37E